MCWPWKVKYTEETTITAPHYQNPCLAPSLASIYIAVSPPNYDNVRFSPPWGMRWGNKTGGQNKGQNRGWNEGRNRGRNRQSGTKQNYTRFQGPHHLWQEKVWLVHIVVRCPHHLKIKMQEYFSLGGCAGIDVYNIFVYLNVIARIFHFGRVCWSWYLQYFCIFECYCKNISLWEGVLVLISTIFLYIWMLLQEYFTLGGCAGLKIYNIFVYLYIGMLLQEYFTLGGCAGLDIYNIFVYLNVIARIFHFGRVCWPWYLQYFCIQKNVTTIIAHFGRVNPCLAPIYNIFVHICILACYCKNISLWEGVLVLISTIFLYIWMLLQEYFTMRHEVSWNLEQGSNIQRGETGGSSPPPEPLSCPFSHLQLHYEWSPPNYDNCKGPTTRERNEVRRQDRGRKQGVKQGAKRGAKQYICETYICIFETRGARIGSDFEEACAGLKIYNIFVYLYIETSYCKTVFHFGRVCWSWYLQYYCKYISLWEGVLVLKSTISLYICILACYCKNISLWEGVLVLISTIFLYIWLLLQEYFTLGGCAGLDISQYFLYIWMLLQEYFTLGGCAGLKIYNIFVYLYIGMLLQEYFTLGGVCWPWKVKYTEETTITAPHHQNPCLAPSLASIYVTVSPPNYDNVRFPPPWGMRWGNKTGGEMRGETGGKMRGETGGKTRGETGGKTRGETGGEKQGAKWGAKQGAKQGVKQGAKQGVKQGRNRVRNVCYCKNISLWEGCAGLEIYNIFVYLNVIARIFHFGRVCWSWYLQYFCIFECYCKNISLWEGVLVLISTIFLYIGMLLQEYFTLGGCAGLDIYNIFVYLNVIARIFHFGRVCRS